MNSNKKNGTNSVPNQNQKESSFSSNVKKQIKWEKENEVIEED